MNAPRNLYKYRQVTPHAKRMVEVGEVYYSPASHLNDIAEGVFRVPDLDLSNLIMDRKAPLRRVVEAQMKALALKDAVAEAKRSGILSLAERPNCPLMWAHYAGEHSGICVELRTEKLPQEELKKVQYSTQVPSFYDQWFEWKSDDWSYEQEWRCIGETHGPRSLGPDAVSAVIMGARISDADRAAVTEWVRGLSDVALRQVRLAADSFGLVIEDA